MGRLKPQPPSPPLATALGPGLSMRAFMKNLYIIVDYFVKKKNKFALLIHSRFVQLGTGLGVDTLTHRRLLEA